MYISGNSRTVKPTAKYGVPNRLQRWKNFGA
jgi:hypothetical protein